MILVLIPQLVFTQTVFSCGPELGLTVTSRNQKNLSFLYFKDSDLFISPMIGISGSVEISKHFTLRPGLQFETVGYRYAASEPYEMNIKFNKICIPLIIDISCEIKKIKPSIFIGYRPNLLLSGKYYDWGTDMDLFSIGYPVKRYKGQITTGLSVCLGNASIRLAFFGGKEIKFGIPYSRTNHAGGYDTNFSDYFFRNNELVLSMDYLFKFKKTDNKI